MPKVTDEQAVDTDFGLRFRRAWRNSKLSDKNQSELAKEFDYSKQGINFIFNGHRYPHLSSGVKIAKEFDVCLDWLYTGREPMRPGNPDPYLKLASKLMPLTGLRMKLVDLFIGLVVDGRIDAEDMICWLVDQYGIGMTEERETIANRLKAEEEIRRNASAL